MTTCKIFIPGRFNNVTPRKVLLWQSARCLLDNWWRLEHQEHTQFVITLKHWQQESWRFEIFLVQLLSWRLQTGEYSFLGERLTFTLAIYSPKHSLLNQSILPMLTKPKRLILFFYNVFGANITRSLSNMQFVELIFDSFLIMMVSIQVYFVN